MPAPPNQRPYGVLFDDFGAQRPPPSPLPLPKGEELGNGAIILSFITRCFDFQSISIQRKTQTENYKRKKATIDSIRLSNLICVKWNAAGHFWLAIFENTVCNQIGCRKIDSLTSGTLTP